MIVLLVGSALAHPLSPQDWSVWTAVDVHETTVDVVVVAEIPEDVVHRWLEQEADPAAVRARAWRALAQDATVQVDGQVVAGSWAPVWTPTNGAVADGTYTYMLRFDTDYTWPDAAEHSAVVTVPAFAAQRPYRTAWTEVRAPWCVKRDSARALLGDRMSAHPAKSAAAWIQDEALGTVEITVFRCNESEMKSNAIAEPR